MMSVKSFYGSGSFVCPKKIQISAMWYSVTPSRPLCTAGHTPPLNTCKKRVDLGDEFFPWGGSPSPPSPLVGHPDPWCFILQVLYTTNHQVTAEPLPSVSGTPWRAMSRDEWEEKKGVCRVQGRPVVVMFSCQNYNVENVNFVTC